MRTRTWCVAAALVCLPRLAAAQTVLSEADALARLSADSPRVRAIRAAVDVAPRGRARRRPLAESALHVQSRVGRRRHREHVDGRRRRCRSPGRRGLEVSAASALVDASERRADERDPAGARGAPRRLRGSRRPRRCARPRSPRARDRLRGLADILARREAAGDAAGYDRLRAEREVMDLDADWSAARADRARAQAALAAFFAGSSVTRRA